ncbi:galactose mutarotase-like enzyme [Silvibacterium bohemicum]|uniref:Galactose mutarotase-like enzyme n=1 Tax=Silvibacterium bohemicum TaxID=1577686 RepID=A0A841JZT5_9BACT|nr:hypothetical protein [Silvibacterium bohemicum]MBB6146872.1 galactose mutarotase-like enzyme [Silvibacterium bohemicum]
MGNEIERVLLKTDTLAAVILPAMGGKIASLQKNGIELFQQPLRPYALRTLTIGFEESDASGFDECLPSVAACRIETASGAAEIPDHGEFWRLIHTAESLSPATVRLTAIGSALPIRFERNIHLDGDTVRIDYSVTNTGEHAIPYVWSAHPLFAVDPGDVLTLPPSVKQVTVEGSARNRLGTNGTVHPWPSTTLTDGAAAALNIAKDASEEIGDKLFAEAPVEGWCLLERKTANLRIRIDFDPAKLPFLGLWLCYGGWPDGQAEKQNCIAIEPCTALGDSLELAIKNGHSRTLIPGQVDSWGMTITTSVVS